MALRACPGLITKRGDSIDRQRSQVIAIRRYAVTVGKSSWKKRTTLQLVSLTTANSNHVSKTSKGTPTSDPAASEIAKLKIR